MKEHQDRLLQIPLGTESFYLEEAYRHREITYKLHRLFASWAYLPAETPVFDFFDTYRELLSGNKKQIYRLVDREGDLLMLRSDITLFLAKQMGLILRDEDLPARICYGDTILRHQNREDISRNEFFQVGAELIGREKIEGDLEILLLMLEAFSTLGIVPTVHIGSRRLVDSIFAALSRTEREQAISEVRDRDRDSVICRLRQMYGSVQGEGIAELLRFIGGEEELEEAAGRYSHLLGEEALEALKELSAIMTVMRNLGKAGLFRIDFSEVGEQPYYTGIVFQAYLENLDSAVASGGRYDKLLAEFGFNTPSIGFSMMLRKLEPLLNDDFPPPSILPADTGATFEERYLAAEKRRKSGESISL